MITRHHLFILFNRILNASDISLRLAELRWNGARLRPGRVVELLEGDGSASRNQPLRALAIIDPLYFWRDGGASLAIRAGMSPSNTNATLQRIPPGSAKRGFGKARRTPNFPLAASSTRSTTVQRLDGRRRWAAPVAPRLCCRYESDQNMRWARTLRPSADQSGRG